MPNIMLTEVCNLRCPYCFANEFVNKNPNHITLENFKKALDFIATDPNNRVVGLIGGEPTIHPQFKEILKTIIEDPRFDRATVYTNGIAVDKYWNELSHRKFGFLINCNSPKDIGQANFDKMVKNIDEMIFDKYMGERVSLGINIYKPDFDFGYILDLLKKYKMNHLRFSITVPNMDEQRNKNALRYFDKFKEPMKRFFKVMLESGIVPHYDCNKMPSCMVDEEDIIEFKKYFSAPGDNQMLPPPMDNAINSDIVHCSPVVDICHDLTAIRCFGLSEYTKVKISDFAGFADLRNYYINTIDAFACNTACDQGCADCYRRKTLKCFGGCLAFKIDDIMHMQKEGLELIKAKR